MADEGKRKQALKRLDHIRDGLLHVKATVDTYVRDVQEVRDMIDPPEKGGADASDDPD